MFKKLLKYDLKSAKRMGIPLLIATGALAILGMLDIFGMASAVNVLSTLPEDVEDAVIIAPTLSFLATFLFMYVIIFGLALVVSVMQIFMYFDFYKSTVTDEAYLTFTLPVKAKDIIFSKCLSVIIWTSVLTLATLVAGGLMILVGAFSFNVDGYYYFQDMFLSLDLSSLVPPEYSASYTASIIIAIVYAIVSMLNSLLLVFLIIFFVSTVVRKHKALVAILGVIGINSVYSGFIAFLQGIISLFGSIAGTALANPFLVTNLSLGIMSVVLAGLTVLFFFALKHLMEKKLNLD
ncbi:MAG: hypothetical protein IJ004_03890 [Clostridia bacterium]|nr:hypothetical protein [Clostridia bacterium]